MSDVLFRYLLTARRRERSTWRRLLLADDPLLEAGIEQLVETAAARVEVTSQHERVTMESVTVPGLAPPHGALLRRRPAQPPTRRPLRAAQRAVSPEGHAAGLHLPALRRLGPGAVPAVLGPRRGPLLDLRRFRKDAPHPLQLYLILFTPSGSLFCLEVSSPSVEGSTNSHERFISASLAGSTETSLEGSSDASFEE